MQPSIKENTEASSWKKAKEYSALLGLVPSSFSTAIRIMVSDQQKNNGAFRAVTKYQVARLMQGPSFKSMLYYATLELRAEKIKGRQSLSVGDMLDMFEPFDVAIMVGGYLVFRKWRKFIAREDWDWLVSQFNEESQIGCQIGVAIPQLGMGCSFLISTLHYLALGTILKKDKTLVRKYMQLKEKNGWLDKDQLEVFGCTLQQISTQLLCNLGFGVEITNSYCAAIDTTRFFNAEEQGLIPRMQMAKYWLDALLAGKSQPIHKMPGKFYPLATAREQLDTKIADIQGSIPHWLSRSKNDISKEKTPILFNKPANISDDIPEELRQVFSMEEITKMEENEFDQLIDQLDYENGEKAPAGMVVLSTQELKDLEGMVE